MQNQSVKQLKYSTIDFNQINRKVRNDEYSCFFYVTIEKRGDSMDRKIIITIGREYGSGGREIGIELSKRLNIPVYDRQILRDIISKSGVDEEIFEAITQQIETDSDFLDNKLLTQLGGLGVIGLHERIHAIQKEKIIELAQESCIIIGRCSSYILRNDPDALHLFIRADLNDKKDRAIRIYDEPEAKVSERLHEMDTQRAKYYNYFTGRLWGKPINYHAIINSSIYSMDGMVAVICEMVKQKKM